VSETDDAPVVSAEELDRWEAAGWCVNCGHNQECDAQAVERGEESCDSDRNSMEHECPANTSESRARYDRLVMEPMRRSRT